MQLRDPDGEADAAHPAKGPLWDVQAIAGHCGTIALSYCTNKKDDVIYDALCVASLDNMPTDKSVIQIMAYGAVTHST